MSHGSANRRRELGLGRWPRRRLGPDRGTCLGLCLTAPALAIPELDWRLRLMLAFLLTAILSPRLWRPLIAPPDGSGDGRLGACPGSADGRHSGLSRRQAHHCRSPAGGRAGRRQAGLSTASLFDPDTGEETTVLGRLYGWIALAIFWHRRPADFDRRIDRKLSCSAGRPAADFAGDGRPGVWAGWAGVELSLRVAAPGPGLDPRGNRAGLVEPCGSVAAVRCGLALPIRTVIRAQC